MVIMALDHTRDYFHAAAHFFDPSDPNRTSVAIYFTRWITHFCAPAFSFLAGLSAFFASRNKTVSQLSGILLRRGLWLIFLELTIINFAWYFDIHFRSPGLIVLWALGISMIVLAALIYLPRSFILVFSCALIFGHNLLDNIHYDGNLLWGMLHDGGYFEFSNGHHLIIFYPVVPWIGVMSLGYCFGPLYDKSFNSIKRKKILYLVGFSSILLFLLLNWTHWYGEARGWQHYDNFLKTMMSFLNHRKYPPSLLYLLMTLGPSFILLAMAETWKGKMVNFFNTFGKVPFFYYILHLFFIHIIALFCAQLTGFGWQKMILTSWVTDSPELSGYGFPLWAVYLIWFAIIAMLYPLCKKFEKYKMSHKEKWWLSYL